MGFKAFGGREEGEMEGGREGVREGRGRWGGGEKKEKNRRGETILKIWLSLHKKKETR